MSNRTFFVLVGIAVFLGSIVGRLIGDWVLS